MLGGFRKLPIVELCMKQTKYVIDICPANDYLRWKNRSKSVRENALDGN